MFLSKIVRPFAGPSYFIFEKKETHEFNVQM